MRVRYLAFAALAFAGCDTTDGAIDDANESGGVATEGGGNPFDQINPAEVGPDLSKSDGNAYVPPTLLPPLEDPRIQVSLAGFTVELIDDATGFHKVYPTGVGALGSSGRSFTPVGEFTTHPDAGNSWFWYARRYRPAYFDGLPFMRITAQNSRGYQTYGFHGPITDPLRRGYVSHGCMRMQADDIVELFTIMRQHPGAPVSIRAEKAFTPEGELIDVTPADQDPVAAWRETVCGERESGLGEVLPEGAHSDQILCDGSAEYTVEVERGDRVQVLIEGSAPITAQLTAGEAVEEGESSIEDGRHTLILSMRVADAGTASITIEGAPSTFDLTVTTAALGEPVPADGWVGDGCQAAIECGDLDCLSDLPGGLCTEACERFCPDRDGAAGTFCVDLGFDDGGRCVATCDDDAQCRDGYACTGMPRYNESATTRGVCVPVQ